MSSLDLVDNKKDFLLLFYRKFQNIALFAITSHLKKQPLY